jgi:hypothetical protein
MPVGRGGGVENVDGGADSSANAVVEIAPVQWAYDGGTATGDLTAVDLAPAPILYDGWIAGG